MMYNHTLFVTYGKQKFKAMAEDSPDSTKGLLVWPSDFGLDDKFTEKLVSAFRKWADDQGIKYTICSGSRVG